MELKISWLTTYSGNTMILLPKFIAVFTARPILAAKASWSYPEYSITKRLFPTFLSLKFLLTETGITAIFNLFITQFFCFYTLFKCKYLIWGTSIESFHLSALIKRKFSNCSKKSLATTLFRPIPSMKSLCMVFVKLK